MKRIVFGGISGWISRALISDSLNRGTISGDVYVGGIVGYASINWLIKNCTNTGDYSGKTAFDGIVPSPNNNGKVENCVDEQKKD